MSRISFLVAFIQILAIQLIAQEKTITHKQQEWFQYYNQITLRNNFSLSSDAGFRMQNNPVQLSTLVLRTGISYNLKPKISAALGFANFTSFSDNKLIRSEYRPFEEFQIRQELFSGNLQHRLRIEERFFHTQSTNSNTFNFRFRYRLYLTIPLVNYDAEVRSLFLIVADEVFLNCGHEIIYNLDQNRIIGGIGYSSNKNLQISLSYVHQYAQKNSPDKFEVTDVLWLGITHKIEKRSKEN